MLGSRPLGSGPLGSGRLPEPAAGGFFGNSYYNQLKVIKMAIQKNVASQKWMVFAFNTTTGAAVTGDAANISANISKDWAAVAATNDVNPTEFEDGYYTFDLTQAETNADNVALFPQSSTGNVQVIGVPAMVLTSPASFSDDVIQTADHTAAIATVDSNVDAILVDTGTTIPATISTAQADLDIITGATGVNLLTATQASIDAIETDTSTSIPADIAGLNDIAATDIVSAGAITTLSGAVVNVDLVDTTTTNTDMLTVDDILDESLATHQTALSLGRAVTLGGAPIAETTMTGTPTTTSIQLAAGSTTDGAYRDHTLVVLSGPLAGETAPIKTYTGATKTCEIDAIEAFTSAGSSGDAVVVKLDHVHPVSEIQDGLATEAKQDIIDTNVDSILVDTGTTLETHLTDIKGATFSGATDSIEAIRNRGDAAWTTGAGGTPPQLLQSTTIATLTTQTSFTLTAGSADDDAYNGAIVVVTDSGTAEQKAVGAVSDYTGSTKRITLGSDPAVFTMAVGDTIEVIAALGSAGSAPTAAAIRSEIDSNSTQLAAIVADTNELQSDDVPGLIATLDAVVDTVKVDTAAILTDTAEIGAAGAGLTALATQASVNTVDSNVDAILVDTSTTIPATIATIDANVDAVLVDTGTTIPAQITALNDISVSDVLTTQMTESYAADGAAPTLAQALMLIQQSLGDFAISGTTITVKQVDGSTTAATFTLDSSSAPTSSTRAS